MALQEGTCDRAVQATARGIPPSLQTAACGMLWKHGHGKIPHEHQICFVCSVHSHALGEKGPDANPIGNPGKQEGNEHHHCLPRISTGESK
jgi:hypothetical protein